MSLYYRPRLLFSNDFILNIHSLNRNEQKIWQNIQVDTVQKFCLNYSPILITILSGPRVRNCSEGSSYGFSSICQVFDGTKR